MTIDVRDRTEAIARVSKRIGKARRGPGHPPLAFNLLPSEIKAAAEAAVDELWPPK